MPVAVEARDGALTRLGPLTFTKLEVTVRYNEAGSWQLQMPTSERNWALTRTDNLGIIVDWDGVFTFSGYVETWKYEQGDDGAETLTLSGADDVGLLANRYIYPDPTKSFAAQNEASDPADRHYADKVTGQPLETAIKYYITRNVVTPGDTDRAVPFLTVATAQGRGGTVSYGNRFPALMDAVRAMVAAAGPMGVTVTHDGDELVCDVYVPRDLSGAAVFYRELGNLASVSLSSTTPTATNALVAGSGQGVERAFIEVKAEDGSAEDPWTHVEEFVDQRQAGADHGDTPTPEEIAEAEEQMQEAGEDAVARGAAAAEMDVTAVDLPRLRFGTDEPGVQGYGLGDTVTVQIRDGVTYSDIITAVTLTVDSDNGQRVRPTIGRAAGDQPDDETVTAQLAARVRELERQLKALQTGL